MLREGCRASKALAKAIEKDLEEIIPLAEKVIDQTTRRAIDGEQVPFTEKVVSIVCNCLPI